MGPKSTAPDTAPSAASPTRSSASVGEGTHQIAITAAAAILFMDASPQIISERALRILNAKLARHCVPPKAVKYHFEFEGVIDDIGYLNVPLDDLLGA
jgi:hypothetical protein